MDSFIATVEQLFRMSEEVDNNRKAFDCNKKQLQIPLYQREYKWEEDQVKILINDIFENSKFLGIVILTEAKDGYEIVDGQQRITTLFFILIGLYNLYAGQVYDQEGILDVISDMKGKFVLKNFSLSNSEFVVNNNGKINLNIQEEEDQYYQKSKLESIFSMIYTTLEEKLNQDYDKTSSFFEKLKTCKLLVFIYKQDNGISVEQVFLDINDKLKPLDPDEIFKGYCFKKTNYKRYEDMRNKWADLKKCSIEFQRKFAYKDMSQYIYLYMLENITENISTELEVGDKHILEKKSETEISKIIDGMIAYGRSVIQFFSDISVRQENSCEYYCFGDLVNDSDKHKNEESAHNLIKYLCLDIIGKKSNRYQKIPFFYFIYSLKTKEWLNKQFSYQDFQRAVSSFYIYAKLFTFDPVKKTKKHIDHNIYNAINAEKFDKSTLLKEIKALRGTQTNNFAFPSNCNNYNKLAFYFSVIDFYDESRGFFTSIYDDSKTHINNNLEHLVVPNNTNGNVRWVKNKITSGIVEKTHGTMTIPLKEKWGNERLSSAKKQSIDYIIIDKEFNNKILKNYDIVTKLYLIEDHFKSRGGVPAHICVCIKRIQCMKEYKELEEIKDNDIGDDKIKEKYIKFLDAYFSDEREKAVIYELSDSFRDKFK